MTKWGMPGVYTHAFMDGWSPGYLGSVAYNHNGMMRMYETQSGRDVDRTCRGAVAAAPVAAWRDGAAGCRRTRRCGGGGDAAAAAARWRRTAAAEHGRRGATGARRGAAPEPGGRRCARRRRRRERAGGRRTRRRCSRRTAAGWRRAGRAGGGARRRADGPRRRAGPRMVPRHSGSAERAANFTRRNNTNYMQTGVLSALQLTSMFPNLVLENFYMKTRNSIEQGRTTAAVRLRDSRAARHDEAGRARPHPARPGHRGRHRRPRRSRSATRRIAAGSYVIKGGQPYWRLAKNLLEKQDYPDPALRTYDDSGWSMGHAFNVDVKEIRDKAILDVRGAARQGG